jgi:hypothetical protein
MSDGHLVRHAARQSQRLEEVRGLAGEDGDAVGAVGRQIVLEEAAGALERGLEGRAILV